MQKQKSLLNEFLCQLYQLERKLDQLEKSSDTIVGCYNNNLFPEQTELASDKLENLIIAVTHETASQIGFYRNDIETLASFIDFREKYANFSDTELAQIIDADLSINSKLAMSSRFDCTESMLTELDELKHHWNQIFKNKKYAQIKKQLQIYS